MSDPLFDEILKNGMGYTSPSIAVSQDARLVLAGAKADIARLPVSSPENPVGIAPEAIAAGNSAITTANNELTSTEDYLQGAADEVFARITGSNLAGIDSGCGGINAANALVTGAADSFIRELATLASGVSQSVEDYLADLIDETAMESVLNALQSQFDGPLGSITGLVSGESGAIAAHLNQIESVTLTDTVRMIWADPCARMVLDKVLPERIKEHL